jgi:hypothetical protein
VNSRSIAVLAAALLSSLFLAKAQDEDKVYLNEVLAATNRKAARYYRVVEGNTDGLYLGRTYTMEGKLKSEGTYLDAGLRVEHGRFTFYHANGAVESSGEYVKGHKTGIWERFDSSGRPLAEKVYTAELLENIVHTRAETMPVPPQVEERDLVRAIKAHVAGTAEKRVKGQGMASFIVEKDGGLSEVKMVQGIDAAVDAAIVQALKDNGPWTPGLEKGIPVRVVIRLPLRF